MNDVDLGEPVTPTATAEVTPRPYPQRTMSSGSNEERPDPPESRTPRRQVQQQQQDDTETGHAGDLPGIEEYKAQHGIGGNGENKSKCFWRSVYAFLVIVIAVVLVTIGVVIGRDEASASPTVVVEDHVPEKKEPTSTTQPNSPLDEAPKGRLFEIINFIEKAGWTQKIASGTPPYSAASWLANQDEAQMQPVDSVAFKERYALAVLYYAFEGDNWPQDTNWFNGPDRCGWFYAYNDQNNAVVKIGTVCNEEGSAVTEIRLRGLQMYGTIPAEVSLFESLEVLDLRHNKLKDGIPQAIEKLSNLNTLILEDNNFIGGIPSFLGNMKKLSTVNLSRNAFSGQLPAALGTLPNLHFLSLEHNLLSGPLSQLQGLGTVQALLLGDNEFTGKLEAPVFNSWRRIQALDLSDNKLKGQVPEDLFAISNLNVIDLHGNQFSGPLPDLVSANSDVNFLALQQNNFTGNPGPSLQLMEQLEHLDLSNNSFTGTMPTEFGKLQRLKYLFLAYNDNFLFGRIPAEYGNLTKLVDLSLQKTNRVEAIPSELGQLEQLVLLDLNQNILTGKLPPELGNLGRLKYMLLKDNKLDGSIPASYSQLVNLDTVVIDQNSFTGTAAPFCDPKLPKLQELMASCRDFECSCCNHCCTEGEAVCEKVVWFAEQDPVYSEHYQFDRWFYMFHESYVRYPVFHDNPGE